MPQNNYETYIYKSRYARFDYDKGRREEWPETVDRYFAFFRKHIEENYPQALEMYDANAVNAKQHMLELKDVPSMRAVMTAGPALDRDHVAGYNCSYTPIESLRDFDEIMYILLCGTGVGYSVESKYVSKLPEIAESFHKTDTTIVVADSKIGWASAFRELVSLLASGKVPKYDVSRIRPAGAPLRTFGGRASGPEPLQELFDYTINMFRNAKGRKLTTLEASDLVCKIASVVVVGGVRRSALICLSDLEDDLMRNAKTGQWWEEHPERALANISAVYERRPALISFIKEWTALYRSKSGERGIFSRYGAAKGAELIGREPAEWGTNPCAEIILRPKQFCNLSEVVAREDDDLESLLQKVGVATFFGTIQSTLTDFRYLRKKWKDNCEEERLLGVSITGICDSPFLYNDDGTVGEILSKHSREVNALLADALGIPRSACITCIKPSGTVSQLVNSSSGIHPRYSKYYIRTVRADINDPLCEFMKDAGFSWEEDVHNNRNLVFSFPIKSPDNAITTDDMSAMQQLDMWMRFKHSFTEHNPSITVYYNDKDFLDVGAWVWNNLDSITGLSFLPYSGHVYKQAPYQPIDQETYEKELALQPKDVDWSKLSDYEKDDRTTGSQELACVGNSCEIP